MKHMITASMAKTISLEHRNDNSQQTLDTLDTAIKYCAEHSKTSCEIRLKNNLGIYKEVKRHLKACGYKVKVYKHKNTAEEEVTYKISWR